MTGRMIVGGVIGVALVVGILIALTIATSGSDSDDGSDFAGNIGDTRPDLPAEMFDGFSLGSADAPLTLTVFEDFQCPFCVRYSTVIEPVIIEEFVATGELRLEFRNFPILGAESVNTAAGSVCAAQDNLFWDYAASVFRLQAAAGQITDEQLNVGRLDTASLVRIAGDVGLDGGSFESCLASGSTLSEVQSHIDEANSFGVRGTPSFILNGTPISRPPSDTAGWRNFLNEQLATTE